MKKKEMKKQDFFEREYDHIMKTFQKENVPFYNNTTWINPGDYIVKFSLYTESNDSVVSTNTSTIL